jgi:hypothetical protein
MHPEPWNASSWRPANTSKPAGRKKPQPRGRRRIADALDLVNLYLKELDEAATEKRYGLQDADPFTDAKGRVLAALARDADLVREERIKIDGGLPPAKRMEIREELE